MRHDTFAPTPDRAPDSIPILPIDDFLIHKRRRADAQPARSAIAMTGGTVLLEDQRARMAVIYLVRMDGDDVIGDGLEIGARQHAIGTKGRHLAETGLVMGAVDADADSLGDALRIALPQPVGCDERRIAGATRRILAMADGAIIGEKPRRRRHRTGHEVRIGGKRLEIRIVKGREPLAPPGVDLLETRPSDLALIEAEQTLGIAGPGRGRPGRPQQP